ncbi:MAG: LPS export ABC transporter permease LptF [Alphaproteobacteria bacterium]|nr:LPS export ABC transporter permease LptF [Alphaproteobacteria bacterium]
MIVNRYIFKNLFIATAFIAMTLAAVIFLTQSLRFLELVINAGASGSAFWMLTLMALPRFFEIILPIALMSGIIFVYNRMTADSELVVMKSVGLSPLQQARPALLLAALVTLILMIVTTWIAPVSLSSMHQLRQVIKAQYSVMLFREGVFNAVIPGLTVFVRDRSSNGELQGLMIHDTRDVSEGPVTILAKRGNLLATPTGQQVLVYDGTRQSLNHKNDSLNRLNFERYTIDMPEAGPIRQRWQEPDERTLWELLHPAANDERAAESRTEFQLEIHRRLLSPLLALCFAIISLCALLLGPLERRGLTRRIIWAVGLCIIIQGLFLGAFSLAKNNIVGLLLMYLLVLGPVITGGRWLVRGRMSWRKPDILTGAPA